MLTQEQFKLIFLTKLTIMRIMGFLYLLANYVQASCGHVQFTHTE